MNDATLILPVPISSASLRQGGVETLVIGNREIRFRLPPGGRPGGRVRLPHAAHLIDPSMKGGDLYLLVLQEQERPYGLQRHVQLDLCLPSAKLHQGSRELITVGSRKIEVRIPAGLNAGNRLRLRGLGQHLNGGFPGDVYLRLALTQQRARWWAFAEQIGRPTSRVIGISFQVPFLSFYHEWTYESKTIGLGVAR